MDLWGQGCISLFISKAEDIFFSLVLEASLNYKLMGPKISLFYVIKGNFL